MKNEVGDGKKKGAFKMRQSKLLYGKKFATDKKKKEAETRRNQKAAMLRNYAKLCRREGIQSNRVHIDGEFGKESPPEPDQIKAISEKGFILPKTKEVDSSVSKNTSAFNEKTNFATDTADTVTGDERRNQILEKTKLRKMKKRSMMKRNSKGQPLLQNRMKLILDKIQRNT